MTERRLFDDAEISDATNGEPLQGRRGCESPVAIKL